MSIGTNLKKLLLAEKISEKELSRRVGIPQQIINRIINGKNVNPKLSTIDPIAKYFNVPLQDLINEHSDQYKKIIPTVVKIPYVDFKDILLNGVDESITNTTQFITLDLQVKRNYFATTMPDESMEPKFSVGTILIFEKDKEIDNGDFCLLRDEDNNYMLRQILINPLNKKFIKCLNPTFTEYNTIPMPLNVYVLAKLLESRTSF